MEPENLQFLLVPFFVFRGGLSHVKTNTLFLDLRPENAEGKSEPKIVSQMVVRDGDESHGTIRRKSPNKNKSKYCEWKKSQLICAKISTIQKDAHCSLSWGENHVSKRPSAVRKYHPIRYDSSGPISIPGQISIIPKPELMGFWGGFPY